MGAVNSGNTADSRETVGLTIGSRLEYLTLVHGLIQSIARQHELDEETENALIIAVIEAGTNAIQHGNAFAADKSVSFLFTVGPRDITVRVDDSGNGFDPSSVANPTDDSHLLVPHGRGLYLMRSLMDEVTFDHHGKDGTSVVLKKARLTEAR
jgi:serine/threonine-protein kinase RsbW